MVCASDTEGKAARTINATSWSSRSASAAGDHKGVRSVRAARADLLDELPGIRLPDLDELRARRPERQGRRRTPGPGGIATPPRPADAPTA